jgi:single-strand DNA-binding protein
MRAVAFVSVFSGIARIMLGHPLGVFPAPGGLAVLLRSPERTPLRVSAFRKSLCNKRTNIFRTFRKSTSSALGAGRLHVAPRKGDPSTLRANPMPEDNTMNHNKVSLAGSVYGGAPRTLVARDRLTYTTFDLLTFGSHQNRKDEEVHYHEVHHIVCVGTLDTFVRSIRNGAEIEVTGELRTRKYTTYLGDPAEVEISYWRKEVVATSIRPEASVVAAEQRGYVDPILIALYRPDEF